MYSVQEHLTASIIKLTYYKFVDDDVHLIETADV